MIIIYNCYGGTHSSILCSSVHLGMLPKDRVPTKKEILELKYFNKLNYKDMGRLIFHGIDEDGNKVYTIGRGTSKALIPAMKNLTNEFHSIYSINDRYAFVNTSPTVPPSMTMGGFFSRGLKINTIGVPLLAIGAQKSYFKTVELVAKTKKLCKENSSEYLVMDIDGKGRLSFLN